MIILILVVDDQLNLQHLAHAQIIPLFKENKNPKNTLHSCFSASTNVALNKGRVGREFS